MLSIGCGLGYVEDIISTSWNGELIAVEPAKSGVDRWIRDNKKIIFKNGYFPDVMNGEEIDFAYANAIDYVFNDKELHNFLTNVYNYPIREFLLISASLDVSSFESDTKYAIKKLLSILRLKRMGQFWGYLRTTKEYRKAILNAGFTSYEDGFLDNGQYWIKGKIE